MRSIDWGRALLKNNSVFVRTIDVARAEHRLIAFPHTSSRGEDVVVPIPLVQLGPFQGAPALELTAINDDVTLIQHAAAIRAHAVKSDNVGSAGATSRPRVH